MAITLHAECRRRYKELIVECISKATVDNNKYVQPMSMEATDEADAALPGKVLNSFKEMISDAPTFTFLYDTICRDLESNDFQKNINHIPLTEFPRWSDPAAAADRLID